LLNGEIVQARRRISFDLGESHLGLWRFWREAGGGDSWTKTPIYLDGRKLFFSQISYFFAFEPRRSIDP
jgi:hypothetical protein